MHKPLWLTRHPAAPSSASTLRVGVSRVGGDVLVKFRIPGDTSGLRLPAKAASEFRHKLWEHSCFELFIRPDGSREYIELNFSPSTEWAAYGFDGYREAMRDLPLAPRKIIATASTSRFELSARVPISEWESLPWRVSVSAVLEEKDGARSYWALRHPPGKPDFHHPDCFALELPPAPLP